MTSDFPVCKTVRGKCVYKRRANKASPESRVEASRQERKVGYGVQNAVSWGLALMFMRCNLQQLQ